MIRVWVKKGARGSVPGTPSIVLLHFSNPQKGVNLTSPLQLYAKAVLGSMHYSLLLLLLWATNCASSPPAVVSASLHVCLPFSLAHTQITNVSVTGDRYQLGMIELDFDQELYSYQTQGSS